MREKYRPISSFWYLHTDCSKYC